MQTIAQIQETLPDVQVQLSKRVIAIGKLCGRKNAFATVTCVHDGITMSFEYAWETIVHALNNNTVLQV